MSGADHNPQPAGEDIHLPGGSIQPLLLTVGITLALLGVTGHLFLLIAGCALTVGVLIAWIRGAIAEYRHLPLEHDHH